MWNNKYTIETERKMGTRCQIRIAKEDLFIYVHKDAYPENMIPIIKKGVEYFLSIEEDAEYLLAWLITWIKTKPLEGEEGSAIEFPSDIDTRDVGVCTKFREGLDWLYEITDKQIVVYKCLVDAEPVYKEAHVLDYKKPKQQSTMNHF
jgi:hypothetical protein